MASEVLDDFEDPAAWTPVASGLAKLTISQEPGPHGTAMRLDFDFAGGGGFVVARKACAFALPESYAVRFNIRGPAPANRFELKLSDPSGSSVWWYHEDAFDFPADWRPMRIRSSQIEFAWGPAGGGPIAHAGAIELVIAAGPGGKGTVWIDDLRIEDTTYRATPSVRASSALPGHDPSCAADHAADTSWRSEGGGDGTHWLLIDFQQEREYGGLIIRWLPEARPRAFAVHGSGDGAAWTTVYSARRADAARSDVYLPNGASRYLRLDLMARDRDAGVGIVDLEVKPFEFSRSLNAFFENVARSERPGLYPKYWYGQQTYWSPVGVEGGTAPAILNEEGMVEVDPGSFSIEPFLFAGDTLITWADAERTQALERGHLPIPSSRWGKDGLVLQTTAFATRGPNGPVLYVRYRVENTRDTARQVRLFVALRPFQVTPPWQAFKNLGGVSPIRELTFAGGAAWVNRTRVVIPLSAPTRFGAAAFEQGAVTAYLESGDVPPDTQVADDFGYASGAFRHDLDLASAGAAEVYFALPFGETTAADASIQLPPAVSGAAQLESALHDWENKLAGVGVHLPPAAGACGDTLKTAVAHILVNRDGSALQPGPRRYTRSWIRDGATMAAALLRMGCAAEARDFITWYAPYQRADGNVPCCVDRDGPDWLAEHDSHGQLIFTIMECFRFTRDRAFLAAMWPAARRAAAYLEALRDTRLTPEYEAPEKRARYGLLPESVSHEGYLAHPVHAYWDDFWALRGLRDAAAMAAALGERAECERLSALRDSFQDTLYASIAATIADRTLDYVPGSVEWADFDPAATATAIATVDALEHLPREAVDHMYAQYLAGFRGRCAGTVDWANYSPYEIRIIGALVRMGERQSASELLRFFLSDRRPPPWNQWPEIAWRDPTSPGHIGDMPHTWIAAEYVLAVRSMLVFEREADAALVIAAGVPEEWLDGGAPVVVTDLPTYYGALSYTLRREGADTLRLSLSGDLAAPGGTIVVRPPLPRPLAGVEVNGWRIGTFDADSVTIAGVPAEVVLRY